MTDMFISETGGPPKDQFGRRERGGIMGSGLNLPQLIFAIAVLAAAVTWLLVDATSFFGLPLVVAVGLIGYGVGRFRGESLIVLTVRPIQFYWRQLNGQTLYLRQVWRKKPEITVKNGTPAGGATVPETVGDFDLPGALGTVRLYQSGHSGGGAFLIDFKAQTVATTIAVTSRAWELRDPSAQESSYHGFVEWMNGLNTLPALVQADARVRVDSAPAAQLAEYRDKQDAANPNAIVSDQLRHEYDELIRAHAPRSMVFSNTVTFTFGLRGLAQQIKDNGGGLAGIDGYLTELIAGLRGPLEPAGVTVTAWLKAIGLQALFSRAMDPVSFSQRTEQATPAQRATQLHPPVMGVRELRDRVEIDGSVHQVFWFSEWPRNNKPTGFIDRILYAGDGTRTLLIQMKPVPDHQAANRVVSRRTALEMARLIRQKQGMVETVEQRKEIEEVEEREERISQGFADVEFRGFIALSAGDKEGLDRNRSAVEQSARASNITLALLYFQQAAAFATVALPLTAKGKAA